MAKNPLLGDLVLSKFQWGDRELLFGEVTWFDSIKNDIVNPEFGFVVGSD